MPYYIRPNENYIKYILKIFKKKNILNDYDKIKNIAIYSLFETLYRNRAYESEEKTSFIFSYMYPKIYDINNSDFIEIASQICEKKDEGERFSIKIANSGCYNIIPYISENNNIDYNNPRNLCLYILADSIHFIDIEMTKKVYNILNDSENILNKVLEMFLTRNFKMNLPIKNENCNNYNSRIKSVSLMTNNGFEFTHNFSYMFECVSYCCFKFIKYKIIMKPIGYLEIALLESLINLDINSNTNNTKCYIFLYEYHNFLNMLIKKNEDITILRNSGIIFFGQEYDDLFLNIVSRRLKKKDFMKTTFYDNCYRNFSDNYNSTPKWLLNKLIRYFFNDFPSFFFNTIVLIFTVIQIPQLILSIINK
jgi:hypothetical protein